MIEQIDHCSLFFEIWNDIDISGCCLVHDEMYEDNTIPRKLADETLRD